MSARNSLSPHQFVPADLEDDYGDPVNYFHGSDHDFDPGEMIHPGRVIGRDNFGRADNAQVYMTQDRHLAGLYGSNVYEVHPHHDVDLANKGRLGHEEYVTSKARVLRAL